MVKDCSFVKGSTSAVPDWLLAELWTHVMQECHMWQQIFSFILTNADIYLLYKHITDKYQVNHGQLVLKQIPASKIDVHEHTESNCQICNNIEYSSNTSLLFIKAHMLPVAFTSTHWRLLASIAQCTGSKHNFSVYVNQTARLEPNFIRLCAGHWTQSGWSLFSPTHSSCSRTQGGIRLTDRKYLIRDVKWSR